MPRKAKGRLEKVNKTDEEIKKKGVEKDGALYGFRTHYLENNVRGAMTTALPTSLFHLPFPGYLC